MCTPVKYLTQFKSTDNRISWRLTFWNVLHSSLSKQSGWISEFPQQSIPEKFWVFQGTSNGTRLCVPSNMSPSIPRHFKRYKALCTVKYVTVHSKALQTVQGSVYRQICHRQFQGTSNGTMLCVPSNMSPPRTGGFARGKECRYPLYKRLGGPQDRCGWNRKISLPPEFDSLTVHSVASRYTDWAIPVHQKQLYLN